MAEGMTVRGGEDGMEVGEGVSMEGVIEGFGAEGTARPTPEAFEVWERLYIDQQGGGGGARSAAGMVRMDAEGDPLEVMCGLIWMHGPRGTIASALAFKPVLKEVATHVSESCARAEPRAVVCVTSALLMLAELHPVVRPVVKRHCLRYEVSFRHCGAGDGPGDGAGWLDAVELAKAGYRAVCLTRKASVYPWDWKSYIDLMGSEDARVRWFVLNACGKLLGLPQQTRIGLLSRDFSLAERLQHYLDWRFEQRKLSELRSRVLYSDTVPYEHIEGLKSTVFIPTLDGVTISDDGRRRGESNASYVRTASCTGIYEYILASLEQNRHMILFGPAGCGKSALMKSLREQRRKKGDDVLTVHMHKSMDSRALVGTYVCTSQAGEFQWKEGPLTIAALQGKWLCIEEINSAPQEALALLAGVSETNEIHVPGRGTLRVKPGFMMFGLCTHESGSGVSYPPCSLHLQSRVWAYHSLPMHTVDESVDIALALYPALSPLRDSLSSAYSFVSRIVEKGWQDDKGTQQAIQSADLSSGEVMANLRCKFNLRHLLQLCNRLVECHGEWITPGAPSETIRKMAFYHTVDVFCGSIRDEEFGKKFSALFLGFWGLSSYHKDEFDLYKPVMDVKKSKLTIGRASLGRKDTGRAEDKGLPFVVTTHSLRLLERTAIAIQTQEPILLVGETGIGKTACIQHLSAITGTELLVLNMNQQSDSSDLVGSFRPVESHLLLMPMLSSFQSLVSRTWPAGNNIEFFRRLHSYAHKKKWMKLIHGFKIALQKLLKSSTLLGAETFKYLSAYLLEDNASSSQAKRAKIESESSLGEEVQKQWRAFVDELSKIEVQVLTDMKSNAATKAHFSFSFIEGILVRAMKEGKWLLVDEINLAPSEALEKLFAVLDSKMGTFSLTERGDTEVIERHPDFRFFAAMNPGTDAGKKELAANLRSRFTEFYVQESLCREDLEDIVRSSFKKMSMDNPPATALVDFYLHAKQESKVRLYDCAGQKPHYSLRTLCRTLEYILKAIPMYGMSKSIKDGVFMAFFTQLDKESRSVLSQYLHSKLGKEFNDEFHERSLGAADPFVQFESFFLRKGPLEVKTAGDPEFAKYIITKSIKQRLRDLARAIYFHKSPILLQGPTSAGKTSLIKHIASATGYKCIRINNHANTDVQEYTGTYSTDMHGNIRFHEGPLVQALRMGHWVILDELNLAPSDVLEALNRLLDDNRELYVPEINETIKPHPNFMLFATQNPAGAYGGRKTLSRAFRNRFIEIYVDDIPEQELPTILEKSCLIAESQAKRMVQSSKKLRQYRQKSAVFAGKHGYITPRDLLKWGYRSQRSTLQEMSDNGYSLLAERLRDEDEKVIVKSILEKEFKATLKTGGMYGGYVTDLLESTDKSMLAGHKISMGKSMQRLFALIHKCWQNGEPVLLVGETGCGKTTACQLLAQLAQKRLHIYNCHQHSETSDFIGSYRPSRNTQGATENFLSAAREILGVESVRCSCEGIEEVDALSNPDCSLLNMSKALGCIEDACAKLAEGELLHLSPKLETMRACHAEMRVPFEWVDGPLVTAMKSGDFILVDELSLAEDAVLERLNSVLEVGGSITLSEKGSDEVEEIVPKQGFFLLATMNPGGDFGKRELSPALRNRFTEVWVPPIQDLDEIRSIIKERLSSEALSGEVVENMLKVWQFLYDNSSEGLEGNKKQFLSIRDLAAWADFINLKAEELGPSMAFGHGAYLVFLDGFGVGTGNSFHVNDLKEKSEELVANLSGVGQKADLTSPAAKVIADGESEWGIHPFFVSKGSGEQHSSSKYSMTSRTAMKNLWRILRAMQMQRALLLEGSPGVGKSSMIQNLAFLTSNQLVRINLSEHTDMMDLLGAESPCDPSTNDGALFKWQDGPLLLAIKNGSWVLLDELNLAQQSVLEGLNALLDHRAEIFIPELNKAFVCSPSFKIFATQNPMHEGGGRKGLPKSFLNRFTKVYMEGLNRDDFHHILEVLYSDLPQWLLHSILAFNDEVKEAVRVRSIGQSGGPWDFNFRDVTRCIDIIYSICQNLESLSVLPPVLALQKKYAGGESGASFRDLKEIAGKAIESVYMQRMRSAADKSFLADLFLKEFELDYFNTRSSIPEVRIGRSGLCAGLARMECNTSTVTDSYRWASLDVLQGLHTSLESAVYAISNGWMCSFVGDWKAAGISIPSFVAGVTGHDLKVIKLTNCTDTSDLLGSFEQHSLEGEVLSVCRSLSLVIKRVSTILMEGEASDMCGATNLVLDLQQELLKVESFALSCSKIKGEYLLSQLDAICKRVVQMKDAIVDNAQGEQEFASTMAEIIATMKAIASNAGKKTFSGFSWIDGPLVESIKEGKWILLEDANLCNPAVLDRLNPLLEGSNSYFMLNESTGSMERLTPHRDFRLFLAWDPSCGGEISRAMRNRGIEINFMRESLHLQVVDRIGKGKCLDTISSVSGVLSCMLSFFAKNGVRPTLLSEGLLSQLLSFLGENPQASGEEKGKEILLSMLMDYFSILDHTSYGVRGHRQHMEFAMQYTRSLHHHRAEGATAGNKVIGNAKVLSEILSCYYGRLNMTSGDLLEPDFLVLDSDSTCLVNLLGASQGRQKELRHALEHFLYSARSEDDLALRQCYALRVFHHAGSLGPKDSVAFEALQSFVQKKVPNPLAGKIFEIGREIRSCYAGTDVFQHLSQDQNLDLLMGQAKAVLEQLYAMDESAMVEETRNCINASVHVDSVETMSVLSFSIGISKSGELQYMEESLSANAAFKHVHALLISFYNFENAVFKSLPGIWTKAFRDTFSLYQKQRSHLVQWMETERAKSVQNFDYFVYLLVGMKECVKRLRCDVNAGGSKSYHLQVASLWDSVNILMHNLTGIGEQFQYEIPKIYEAGKPLCVADSGVLALMKMLRSVGSALTFENGRVSLHQDDFAVSTFRKDIQKGVALIFLAAQDGDEDKLQSANQICEILEKKYSYLLQKSAECNAMVVDDDVEPDEHVHKILAEDMNLNVYNGDHWKSSQKKGSDDSLQLLFSWKPYRQLAASLQNLADFHNLLSELQVLPTLVGFCNSDEHSAESLSEARNALQRITLFATVSQVHELSYNWFESLVRTCKNFACAHGGEEESKMGEIRLESNLFSSLYYGHGKITSELISYNIPCVLQRVYINALKDAEMVLHKSLKSINRGADKDYERRNQIEAFKQILLCHASSIDRNSEEDQANFNKIKCLGSSSTGSLDSLSNITQSIFPEACGKLTERIIQALRDKPDGGASVRMQTGHTWLLLGLLRIHLAVPPNGYDPALKPAHEAGEIEVERAQDAMVVDIIDQTQLGQYGQSFPLHGVQSALTQKLKCDAVRIAQLKRNIPLRDDSNVSYQDLVRDVSAFLAQRLGIDGILSVLGTLESDPLALDSLNSIGETAAMWSTSMKAKYSSYADILQPLNLGVLQFSYGVSAINAALHEKKDFSTKLFGELLSFPGGNSSALAEAMATYLEGSQLEVDDKHLRMIRILRCCLAGFVDKLRLCKFSNQLWNMSNALLGQYTHIWDIAKEKEDRELEEAASLFKSSARGGKEGSREFQRVLMDEDGNYEQDSFIEGEIKENIKEKMERDFAYEIMLNHWRATQAFKEEIDHTSCPGEIQFIEDEDAARLEEFVDCYDALSDSKELQGSYLQSCSHGVVNAHIMRTHLRQKLLSESQGVLAMHVHVQRFYARVDKIREEWPDNELLAQLRNISGRLLLLPADAPIKKAMSGLELLLLRSLTWEESAAQHVSLRREIESLTIVANGWRKEELKSMEDLFKENFQKHVKMASVGWLHLFEILKHFTSTKACKLNLGEILESIEEFIQTSSIGQFETRLAIVKMFYTHLQVHALLNGPTAKRYEILRYLSGMLQNLHSYYSQFLESIRGEIESGTGVLSKELFDFIQLSKWEDLNVYAMRNSIDKSNRTLHKLRVKHDELLRKGIKDILQAQSKKISINGLSSEFSKGAKSSNIFESLSSCCWNAYKLLSESREGAEGSMAHAAALARASPQLKSNFRGNDKHSHRKMLPKLVVRASKLCKPLFYGSQHSGYWFKVAACIDDSAFEVAHRASQLRGLDDSAKMQKQKALSDLFKSLKNLGYSNTRKLISLQSVFLKYFKTPSSTSISGVCTSLLGEKMSDEVHLDLFAKSETYFYRSLAAYQELSSLTADYHPDIQGSEFESMVAYVQNLLDTCFQLRSLLDSSALRSGTVRNLVDTMANLAGYFEEGEKNSLRPFDGKRTREWLWKVDAACEYACKLIQDSKLLLENSCYDTSESVPELLEILQSSKDCAREMKSLLAPKFSKSQTMSEMIQVHKKSKKKKISWKDLWPIFPAKGSIPRAKDVLCRLWGLHAQLLLCEKKLGNKGFSALEGIAKSLEQELSLVQEFEEPARGRQMEDAEYAAFMSSAGKSIERTTEDLLIWMEQLSLHKDDQAQEWLRSDEADWDSLQANLATSKLAILGSQVNIKHACQAEENLVQLFQILSSKDLRSEDDLVLVLQEVSSLKDLCEVAIATYQDLSIQTLALSKALAKLTHICSSVFVGLCKDGYCSPPDASDRRVDENGAFEEADGVGMGEGEGAKDVSDKIENEEQVEGLKGDDPGEDKEAQPEENTKGVEMGDDFEGNMFDISEDESDGENNEEEGEEQENLDQQIGDMDETFDAADERLWNDEDEESQNKEKEEDGDAIGGLTDDMMAAEDGNDKDEKEAEQEKNAEQEKEKGADEKEADEEINDMEADKDHGLHVDKELKEEEDGDGEDEEREKEEGGNEGEGEGEVEKQPDEKSENDGQEAAETEPMKAEEADTGDNGEEEGGEDALADLPELGDQEDSKDQDENEEMEDQPGETKEQPNDMEENEEENEGEDPMDTEYQQNNDDLQDNDDAAGNEGPEGQPSRQDLPEDHVNSGAGGSHGMRDQDEDALDRADEQEMDKDWTANKQAGSQNVDTQNRVEHRSNEMDATQQKSGVNPHRKLGEAMEKWKLDVSVTMDLKQTEGAQDDRDPEDVHDEYAYDADQNAGTGDGPEALGQAHETKEDAEQLEGMEEDRVPESREDGDDLGEEERKIVEESKTNPPRTGDDDPVSKLVPKSDVKVELSDAEASEEEEEEGPAGLDMGDDDLWARGERDTLMHVSRKNFASEVGGELQLPGDGNLVTLDDVLDTEEGRAKWQSSSSSVESLVGELTEQLRLTLIPTQISKMAGDFRTGKRLNIRKLIPYIASNFKKDKIWLRRTQPDKRKYQVLLAVDDSRSMIENKCEKFALDSVALLCNAMSRLEVGDLGILSFGGAQGVTELHPLGKPFDNASGVSISSALSFNQESTVQQQPVLSLLQDGLGIFRRSKQGLNLFDEPEGLHQLFLIVADGRINEGDAIKSIVHDALAEGGLMIVFIVLDTSRNSLLDIQTVEFVDGKPVLKKYMDTFAFPHYLLLREIKSLPHSIAGIIKQWIEMTLGAAA
ncbi:midasin [Chloropicon primus]|nr:midasin [Chloropicon primus]